MSPMVVTSGLRRTNLRPVSLNVFRRQSVPPQRAAFGVAVSRPAAVAAAVASPTNIKTMNPARFMAFRLSDRTRAGDERSTLSTLAGVTELVDAPGLGPGGALLLRGSSPL